MKNYKIYLSIVFVLLCFVPLTQSQTYGVYWGDGSDGAITRSSSTTENTANALMPTTYTINSGVTMTCSQSSGAALFIMATVSIDIEGTINCDGRGSSGGAAGTSGTSGLGTQGAGSTGTGSVAGGAGATARTTIQEIECSQTGGQAMGSGGGGGGSGDAVNVRSGGSGGGGIKAGGNSGAAGTTTAVGGTAGAGGNGGGGVFLFAPKITLGASSLITVNGNVGAAGTSNSGGGGGGAGGPVCLWTFNLILVAGQSITSTGGTGGAGGGAGAT
jgi:hypothetical protein